jgi:hypothetical protein
LFALNATYNEVTKGRNDIRATEATISLPDDGRPVYDAVCSGTVPELVKTEGKLTGKFRFGAGQMRVFARTARSIGGIRVSTPTVVRELVVEQQPLRVEFGAALVDAEGRLLTGSAPLSIRLVDPLGTVRHAIHRATRQGTFTGSLPLAVNDPPGEWTLEVRELLAGKADSVKFRFAPPARAAAAAGETRRALYFGNELDNVFRFGRTHHKVTVVPGGSPFNAAAATRLVESLKPWGIECQVLDAAAASKARKLSEEEALTWIGLQYTGSGQIKPGDGNAPSIAGFAVTGPVILLGNAEDHPMIDFLAKQKTLPYKADKHYFPGPSRGFVAWQRDAVGKGQESIALIAYDEAGMQEAVGTLYEMIAGLDPLTRYQQPSVSAIAPAKSSSAIPAAKIAWEARLPDRVRALKVEGLGVTALSHDGSQSTIDVGTGKVTAAKPLTEADLEQTVKAIAPDAAAQQAAAAHARPDRIVKLAAGAGGKLAVAYWGGTVRVAGADGKVASEQMLPQDVTALVWQNGRLLVGLADGRVVALAP